MQLLTAAIITALCSEVCGATDSVSIDRTLRREPVYGTKPQYCLLVFGPEAKFRVWLIVAGEAFYADTNSDGDLTERGKRIYSVGNARVLTFVDPNSQFMWLPVPENERIYQVGDIYDPVGRKWYNVTVRRTGKLKAATFEVLVGVNEKFRQLGKLARFGELPQDAPVLHFNGPLTLGLFTPQITRSRAGQRLSAWAGTNVPAGATGQPTYIVHDTGVPAYTFPSAWVDFPRGVRDGKQLHTSVRLDQRVDRTRFDGPIQVPDDAGSGTARVTLMMPNWKNGNIRAATVELPIVEPTATKK